MNSYLSRLRNAIEAAIGGMTVEDLKRHPEGKWSTFEVLEHLSLTYSGTTKGFEKCLQAGRPLGSALRFKQRVPIMVVTGLGYFPTGREAPEMTRPRGDSVPNVAAEIGPKIEAMDKAITECETRYGKGTLVLDHPVLGPLTANQWRKFHWVHGKHHMKQIAGLRKVVG